MTAFLLIHLSPNDIAPETYDFVHRLNRQPDAYFIAQHGWILAFGNIKALLRSNTVAGWTARRSAFPVWYLDDTPLLKQLNRYLRSQLRWQQRNRPNLWRYSYRRRRGKKRLSDREQFAAIVKRVVALLQSVVENPADITTTAWFRQQAVSRMPGLGLRDFTEQVKLSFGGAKEWVFRQYAREPAHSVSPVGYLSPPLVDTDQQERLERIGRLYKYDCYHPKIGTAPRFGTPQEAQPALCIWPPRIARLNNLEQSRDDYNDRWQLFQTYGRPGLSKEIRLRGSLNIPRDAQHMVENIDNDFGQVSDQEKVA